ncbi:transcriptional regulator with GAF, ATPase, and Fis domain [Nocardioides thalensis]|uniref:Transcriptional regulator with GAF, ATPase, and Fis domain n=1 Tax=Nocardioides thalensis TaxID=1914755 RepID=A0A853C3W8_9ACTN|nr:transcriptional regulator with GAF, ATPase, and Fis domain [Nocardioides thalensis]
MAAALTAAAKAIHAPRSLEETLTAIVRAAQDAIPDMNHAGISISHRDGRIETLAGTDQLVWDLDSVQYDLNEGPCVSSVKDDPVVVVEHARQEQRWPRYMPRAVEAGLRAQLALRLYTDEDTIGGLNLYSTESETVSSDTVQMAELFAAHATIALNRTRYEHQLNEALASRKAIGQAIGLIMQRYQIDEDRAFHFLVRASSSSNLKLRVIADELISSANHMFS